MTDRDETAETAEGHEVDLLETFEFLVRDTCTVCGRVSTFRPIGIHTIMEWAQAFVDMASRPFRCAECEAGHQ